MDAIGGHQVIIIAGDTGCGKSTQVQGLRKITYRTHSPTASGHVWAILYVSKIDLIHD